VNRYRVIQQRLLLPRKDCLELSLLSVAPSSVEEKGGVQEWRKKLKSFELVAFSDVFRRRKFTFLLTFGSLSRRIRITEDSDINSTKETREREIHKLRKVK